MALTTFDLSSNVTLMPYARHADYRYPSNNRIDSRFRQFLALIAAVVIGMIISASVNAIPSGKTKDSAVSEHRISTLDQQR